VFLSDKGRPYADRRGSYGGQIKKGWYGALRRAGLDPGLTPHDCRHTWASWHYAVNRDLLALKIEGGWSSVTLVERYAHLLPKGYEAAIGHFLGHQAGTDLRAIPASA
jgi:integrase